MRRLRISAISYLNTAPLMWDFEHGGLEHKAGRDFDISYTLPSACARSLAEGTADIGIIPAAAYAEIPGLQILPEVAIASRRAVRSILLVSKVPIEKVRTVALDTSSLTSVALTKVLVREVDGRRKDIHGDGARHRQDAGGARCRTADWRSGAEDRPQTLPHARLGGRMDSPHRQAFCFCFLGGAHATRWRKCSTVRSICRRCFRTRAIMGWSLPA